MLQFLQDSRRSDQFLAGRCDGNVRVIFPKEQLAYGNKLEDIKPGDYVAVKVFFYFSNFVLFKI